MLPGQRHRGGTLSCGRYLLAPLTGNKEGSMVFMTLRVGHTSTRVPKSIPYTPVENTPFLVDHQPFLIGRIAVDVTIRTKFPGNKEGRLKRLWCSANLVSSQHSSCPYGQHTKLSACWLCLCFSVSQVGVSFARRVSVRLGGFCVTEVCPPLKRPTCKVCMANTVQEVTRFADQNVHERRLSF